MRFVVGIVFQAGYVIGLSGCVELVDDFPVCGGAGGVGS